jgi:hypothetical protein
MSLMVAPERNSAPPVETWTMPSLPASGEAADGRVQRLRRRDVDGRVGEGLALGLVEHLGVDLGRGDGHLGCSL